MAELDTIVVHNPTSEDFTHNFNGEPYTVKAGETRWFAQFVGYHLAKHLSSKMINDSFTPKQRTDKAMQNKISQALIYDTPERRIALYKILGDVGVVLEAIKRYPFKGFIGEMKVYQDFVEKEEAKKLKAQEAEEKKVVKSKEEEKSKSTTT